MRDKYFQKFVEQSITDFKDHVATVESSGPLTVITWKRPYEWAYAMRFVFDAPANRVYLSGDLGEAIIRPTCACTVKGLATCFTSWTKDGRLYVNPGYFIEKLEATSDRYTYDVDDAIAELQEDLDEYRKEHASYVDAARESWKADNPDGNEEFDEESFNEKIYWKDIDDDELYDKVRDVFTEQYGIGFTSDVWELLETIGYEGSSVASLGRKYHVRIALWLVAFRLIYEQLRDKGATHDSEANH